jgi:hypothetical protein
LKKPVSSDEQIIEVETKEEEKANEVHASPKKIKDESLSDSVDNAKDLTTILETTSEDLHEGGEKEEVKVPSDNSAVLMIDMAFPSHAWFVRWRETLLLSNIKVAIQHTYSKAMAYRNQMIEVDNSYAANN